MALAAAGVTFLVLIVLVIVARTRGGRAPGVPRLLTEPPENVHPAELAVLWGTFLRQSPLRAAMGLFDPQTQRALYQTELLYLAQEGVIELQAIGPVTDPQDLRISLRKEPGPLDLGFVDFLFGSDRTPRTLREVAASSNGGVFAGWAGGLRTKVMLEIVSTQMRGVGASGMTSMAGMVGWALRSFLPLSRQTRGWLARSASLVAFAGAIVAYLGDLEEPWDWFVPAGCIVAGLVAVRLMPYRVPAAFRDRLARWASFRRFLVSHADMDDAPALAVTIWERYLVYASAMQAADEVRDQVRQVIPMAQMLIPWLGASSGAAVTAWVQTLGSLAPAPVKVPKSLGLAPGL